MSHMTEAITNNYLWQETEEEGLEGPTKATGVNYHSNIATADELGHILEQTVAAMVCFQRAPFQNDCDCLKNLFPDIALKTATSRKG